MKPLLLELGAARGLAQSLAGHLSAEVGELDRRQFPDGESYLRFETPVQGRDVILLCTLDRPDAKLAPLLFAAAAARDQGANEIGLVAPYLAYLRQDAEFHPGEAVTSKTFAKLLSGHVDWLVTIDPHLHRYSTLDAIYSVPTIAATASQAIARCVRDNVENPMIVQRWGTDGRGCHRLVEREDAAPILVIMSWRCTCCLQHNQSPPGLPQERHSGGARLIIGLRWLLPPALCVEACQCPTNLFETQSGLISVSGLLRSACSPGWEDHCRMDGASLKFGIPDIDLTSLSGVKINPSSFAGHELVIVFCPNERAAAAKEIDLYQHHCRDFVERDAWILAFSEHVSRTTINGPGRILTIPDADRQAWSAFRNLADEPEAFDRNRGATFLFTRGGNLHRYWHGSEHVDEVLAELKDPSVQHSAT